MALKDCELSPEERVAVPWSLPEGHKFGSGGCSRNGTGGCL